MQTAFCQGIRCGASRESVSLSGASQVRQDGPDRTEGGGTGRGRDHPGADAPQRRQARRSQNSEEDTALADHSGGGSQAEPQSRGPAGARAHDDGGSGPFREGKHTDAPSSL